MGGSVLALVHTEEFHRVRALYVLITLELMPIAALIPVLPFFMIEEIGLGPTEVGLVLALYSASQMFGSWIMGRLSDSVGRAPLLTVCFATTMLGYVSLYYAQTLTHIVLMRMFQGLSGGIPPLCSAYLLDLIPENKQPQFFGLFGGVSGISFVAGPIIGGLLVYSGVDRRNIFVLCGTFGLLVTAYGAFSLEESLPVEKRRPFRLTDPEAMDWVVVNLGLVLVWLSRFLLSFGQGCLYGTYAFLIVDLFGWSDIHFGLVLVTAGLVGAIMQVFVFPLVCKKLEPAMCVAIGSFVGAMSYALYPRPSVPLHIIAILSFTVFGALVEPAFPIFVGLFVDERHLGFGNGVNEAAGGLGQVLGPLLFAWLYEQSAVSAYNVGAAVFAGGAAIAWLASSRPTIDREETKPLV